MKFKKQTSRPALEYEIDLIKYWKDHKTFEKSVEQRSSTNAYVFYDGPPFITGTPHVGTLLSSVVKDAIPRYWTMKGRHVERRWGWDCHGLPAEVFTEQKLGIKDKRDVYRIGLEKYIMTCRENMVQTGSLWEDTIDRIGRWVDFKGAYTTMDKDYMESVWWAFKQFYEAGKIYEGEKVLLYCTRDATPISKAEVAMDNSYQEDTDPSVYVKFKLANEDSYLLAWTTTPWTLPSNTAIAVHNNIEYAEVEVDNERLIIAKKLLDKVLVDERHQSVPYTLKRTFKGKELVGKSYEPLFENYGKNAHKVWHADFVNTEEGTGIAHESPAYGEDDYQLSKLYKFPMVMDTDEEGFYISGEWKGKLIWDVNKEIAKTLHERGIVWKIEHITHSYPHCHRCGTKLMYRAHPSWFLNIDEQRTQMLELNTENINWFPEHMKHGRFENTIKTAPDWNISRDRFWATAMPVWKGLDKGGKEHIKVIGSYAELKELSGVELEDYHRPWIDNVTFTLEGVKYKRIDKVLDCWFESGSMPFAQFHYPFENIEKFEENFPGEFISEYVGQVRAWFYCLHALSTGLFNKNAFNNVIVTGTMAGNDGRKMSKSYGNYTNPNELMNKYSADALRFLLLSSPLLSGEDFSLQDKEVGNVARKLNMIWNMYNFFTLYADVDGWEWDGSIADPTPKLSNPLDQWIISRVHELNKELDGRMQAYDIPNALKPVLEFIDDASNWYVRRSRKRFWKSQNDTDKDLAYTTLHYVLVQLSMILAPFTPFLAEELYRKLTGGESVHLLDWPAAGHINEIVLSTMSDIRLGIEQGLAQRAAAKIKVRQPLSEASVHLTHLPQDGETTYYEQIVGEELNVKQIHLKQTATTYRAGESHLTELNIDITPELKREGVMREVVRFVQNARKQAGLSVDDRIVLKISTDSRLVNEAIKVFADVINQETLALSLNESEPEDFKTIIDIEGDKVEIKLAKAHQ